LAETVTLELSDDVAYRAREAARRTGRRMEDILTDWIKRGVASEDTTLLMPGVDYPIYTPYGNEAAAQQLLDTLAATGVVARTVQQEQ